MAAPCYIAWNAAAGALTSSTAAPPAPALVATGTSVRTMLQIKPGTPKIRIIEWGYSFDVAPTALVKVALIETGTVGATMATGFNAADVIAYNDVTGAASQITKGTTSSGFGIPTAEGTVTATRLLAYRNEWGQSFSQQFPLGREAEINGANFGRIVVTTATTINMSCYCIWEE
jgi:hypothetical protein